MPATHFEKFKARYYECDAFGSLKSSNYLRWMQEAAFAASAAVGYDFSRYTEIGNLWLVRGTDIEFFSTLNYGDEVEIKTWVEDFRRFRSNRAYEFRRVNSGRLCAKATTDWVYLDPNSLKPVGIPEEMGLAFFPEGLPQDFPRRSRPPKAPTPPNQVFKNRRIVGWYEIDMMQHVNNAIYLKYIEESDVLIYETNGYSMQHFLQNGIMTIPRSHHIEYHQPAKYGDTLEISTWHSDPNHETFNTHYEIRCVDDSDLLVRVRSQWGFADTESGKPLPIPTDFLDGILNIKIGS